MKEKKIKNPITGVSITDLTGERFSRLIVLELDIEKTRISKKIHWKCICDCGKKVTVSRNGLMSGKTNSCGCWKSDRVREKNLKDKTGERYGKLVVEQMAYIKNNRTY